MNSPLTEQPKSPAEALASLTTTIQEMQREQRTLSAAVAKLASESSRPSPTPSSSSDSKTLALLAQIAEDIAAERLRALPSLVATEVGKLTAATTSASEQAKAREAAASKLIADMNKSAKAFYTSGRAEMAKVRAEASKAVQQATEEGVKAVQAAVESAGAVVIARADEASDRAEKLTAATNKIEARQLWSAAAAFALALMPAAILVVGWTLGIVGLIWTWQLVAAADIDLVSASSGALWPSSASRVPCGRRSSVSGGRRSSSGRGRSRVHHSGQSWRSGGGDRSTLPSVYVYSIVNYTHSTLYKEHP